ncbi:MAG: hypothetical protein KDA41_03530, partial [Planctomycetales bacterium]|nr:hypothetical protein [Planctomycetales bacterium]
MLESPPFLFAVCQAGAEWALKEEVAARWPGLHFAFSRPGFVTFKSTDPAAGEAQSLLEGSVFARTHGWSLGKPDFGDVTPIIDQVWRLVGDRPVDHVHVFARDSQLPGHHDFEPGPTAECQEIGLRIAAGFPSGEAPPVNQLARPQQAILDCVLIEPQHWMIGWHQTQSTPQRWPGGVPPLVASDDRISRAYLKISEALLWSRLPVRPGDAFIEIGCAPGGSCQALLERGFTVAGVDPAKVDPRLLAHPQFTHIQKRGADLKRRDYESFRWLTADMNVAPETTLETVAGVVTHPRVKIRGLLLTLKMLEKAHYRRIGEYMALVRSWGY